MSWPRWMDKGMNPIMLDRVQLQHIIDVLDEYESEPVGDDGEVWMEFWTDPYGQEGVAFMWEEGRSTVFEAYWILEDGLRRVTEVDIRDGEETLDVLFPGGKP